MAKLQTILLGLLTMSNSCDFVIGRQQYSCPGFSANLTEFSSKFQQPNPPFINNEFKASWIQHKWYGEYLNVNLELS